MFLGDPREIYKNFDGFLLGLNGVICLDSKDKMDRQIAKETSIQLLNHGGDLLIFPEGAWNISANLPVMDLFIGTVDIAIRANADIIPIAIEFYDQELYVAIGENINLSCTDIKDRYSVNQILRDNLATLKWIIMEHKGVQKRASIPKNYCKTFVDNIINGNKETSYTLDDVLDTMFVNKNTIQFETAFYHLNNLEPNKNNAFLFNKRLK